MNKYNVRAVRKELEGCIRSASWRKFRSVFQSVARNPATCQAIVLHRPRTKGSDVHGSLLHAVMYKSNSRPPPGVDIIRAVASAVPQVLHVQDSKGRTPLHVAIDRCAPLEMIECLLRADETGQTLTSVDRNGDTPIMTAVKDCSDDIVELLLRHDEDGRSLLVKSRKRGRTPLYVAASNELWFVGGDNGELPLSFSAILIRTYEALKTCQGRNIRSKSLVPSYGQSNTGRSGDSPNPLGNDWFKGREGNATLDPAELLRAAIACAHLLGKFNSKVFEIILQRNEAESNSMEMYSVPDSEGNTIMHHMCMADKDDFDGFLSVGGGTEIDLLQYLIGKHRDALKHPNISGNLPLHLAILNGKGWKLIQRLVEEYPDAVRRHNNSGELPFHLAIKHGYRASDGVDFVNMANELWRRHPVALTALDASTRLYPFQLAGCYGKRPASSRSCGTMSDERERHENCVDSHGWSGTDKASRANLKAGNDAHVASTVYFYLREAPDVLQRFCPK